MSNIIETFAPYKRIIFIGIGLLIVFLFLAFAMDKCSDYFFERELEQDKKAVNAIMENANDIKSNLSNLAINEALREAETNRARNEYYNAMNETDKARVATNQALEAAERIRQSSINGKGVQNANTARCKAFPESCK